MICHSLMKSLKAEGTAVAVLTDNSDPEWNVFFPVSAQFIKTVVQARIRSIAAIQKCTLYLSKLNICASAPFSSRLAGGTFPAVLEGDRMSPAKISLLSTK